MGPGFYFIAIMGCADGSMACTPVGAMPTRYESQSACAAATGSALAASADFDYPSLIAECRPGRAPAAIRIERSRPLPADARRG